AAAAEKADTPGLDHLINLLESQYQVDGKRSTWLPAEEALERLRGSRRPEVSASARAVFQRWRELRYQRALDEIQQFGGRVRFHPRDGHVMSVQVSRRWTGDDQGLVHIQRLATLNVLFVSPDAGVSRAALDRLRSERPDLSILPWGPGYLGIAGIQW